jgi:hypothetical protein
METRTQPSPSPEMGAYRAPEAAVPVHMGEITPIVPEQLPKGPEVGESAPQPVQSTPITPLPQFPNLPTPQAAPASVQVQSKDSNPLVASDEDLIEKEWVDKAKKIVAQTKDDPYSQEKEVSRLQADYLKKRYGKEIKLSGD